MAKPEELCHLVEAKMPMKLMVDDFMVEEEDKKCVVRWWKSKVEVKWEIFDV